MLKKNKNEEKLSKSILFGKNYLPSKKYIFHESYWLHYNIIRLNCPIFFEFFYKINKKIVFSKGIPFEKTAFCE